MARRFCCTYGIVPIHYGNKTSRGICAILAKAQNNYYEITTARLKRGRRATDFYEVTRIQFNGIFEKNNGNLTTLEKKMLKFTHSRIHLKNGPGPLSRVLVEEKKYHSK